MVIHYSTAENAVACGRSGESLGQTQDQAQVSCKLCLRNLEKEAAPVVRKTPSLAELRSASRAAKTAASVAASKPAFNARSAWQQRLAQLPGSSRLPRGVTRQSFV